MPDGCSILTGRDLDTMHWRLSWQDIDAATVSAQTWPKLPPRGSDEASLELLKSQREPQRSLHNLAIWLMAFNILAYTQSIESFRISLQNRLVIGHTLHTSLRRYARYTSYPVDAISCL